MFGLLSLPFQLLALLVLLIVLGLLFRGKVWSPSFTFAKYNFKLTIAVPQVAFFFSRVTQPPSAAAPPSPPAK